MNLEHARQQWRDKDAPSADDMLSRATRARSESGGFERSLRRRDWTETVAAVIVIAGFTPMLIGNFSWVAKAGAVVIVAHAVGIVMTLWIVRWVQAPPPPPDAPLIETLKSWRESAWRQVRLISAAPWWYVAPSLVGQLLVVAGLLGAMLPTLFFALICIAFCVWVGSINVRTVRNVLRPLAVDLDRQIAELGNEEPAVTQSDPTVGPSAN